MMVLYSGTTDPYSHRCRFVLFEKGMDFEIRDVDLFAKPEDIALMNPYNEVPILVERDLILYESHIINEAAGHQACNRPRGPGPTARSTGCRRHPPPSRPARRAGTPGARRCVACCSDRRSRSTRSCGR